MINDNILKGKWNTIKGEIQKKWGQLTDDELDQVQGDSQKLEGLMQTKLGFAQEKARSELHGFLSRYDDNKDMNKDVPPVSDKNPSGERDF